MMYKYGLKVPKRGFETQPSGYIKHDEVNKAETGYCDYVYYLRQLTSNEVEEFKLDYLGTI